MMPKGWLNSRVLALYVVCLEASCIFVLHMEQMMRFLDFEYLIFKGSKYSMDLLKVRESISERDLIIQSCSYLEDLQTLILPKVVGLFF